MQKKEQHSLNLSGMGTYSGGEFYEVNISGMGKIQGNIKCGNFNTSGTGKVFGNVESDKFCSSGMVKIEGDINSSYIDVSGTLRCEKDVNTKNLDISGMATIDGKINCNNINSKGCLKAKSDIECEEVNINGMINCSGMLNCEKLELQVVGTSTIGEIGGSIINIERGRAGYSLKFNILVPKKFRENKLVANIIEGDDIELENCEVKVVRGKNIKIGENCKIDTVEYSGSLEVDKKSKVLNILEV